MSLQRYFKPVLPYPKGSLTHSIPSAAIAAANHELQSKTETLPKVSRGRSVWPIYYSCSNTLANVVASDTARDFVLHHTFAML